MAFKGYAGEKFNLTPGQLQKAFGPGKVAFDTTDRFGIGSLEMPSTNNDRFRDNLTYLKQSGVDPNSLTGLAFMQQAGTPGTAEQLQAILPLYEKLDKSRADLADRNAQRKFEQEMLAAGFGSLQKGIQTSIAGGSPEMLAYLADAPIRNADAFLSARRGQPRQDIPVFSPQPLPNRQYYA